MTHQGQQGSLNSTASAPVTLAVVSAVPVTVLMAVSLVRLHHFEGVPVLFVILAPLPIFAGSYSLARAVTPPRDPAGRPVSRPVMSVRQLTVVLLTMVELISLSSVLARMSLDDNRSSVEIGMLAASACILGFFAVIQAVALFPVRWLFSRHFATAILASITAVLAVSAAPRRASVLPDKAGQSWSPAPLLAICVLGLLAAALTWYNARSTMGKVSGRRRHGNGSSRIATRLALADLPEGTPPTRRAVVPAFAALVFFALTRDMSMSIALLAGGLAVLTVANQSPSQDTSTTARRLSTSLSSTGIAVLLFAALCWPVMYAGQALGAPAFDPWHVFGYSEPRPHALFYGQGVGLGPGWQFRFSPGTGGGANVLVTVGHQTGVPGLLLLLAAYIVAFGVLALLATKIAKGTAQAALAWGLIMLLLAQFALALATLVFPDQVALGEGPPLLVDSGSGYPTALLSVAIVIGLAWRAVCQAPAADEGTPARSSPSPAPAPVQSVDNPRNGLR